MMIEPFTYDDLPALSAIQPPDWRAITPSFEFYLSKSFCYPLKAVTADRVVGIGAAIVFLHTGWLAHIIVHPEYRGRGIGSEIVSNLLTLMKNKGCQTMSLIATDLGYPVYKKAGFLDEGEYIFYKRNQETPSIPADERIVKYRPQFERSVLELDSKISGEDRRTVIVEKLAESFLYILNGEAAGCYLPNLGEGLIIAGHREAGLALLTRKIVESNLVSIPAQNECAAEFLVQSGFRETLHCRRMVLGPKLAWKPGGIFGRIAGNLG